MCDPRCLAERRRFVLCDLLYDTSFFKCELNFPCSVLAFEGRFSVGKSRLVSLTLMRYIELIFYFRICVCLLCVSDPSPLVTFRVGRTEPHGRTICGLSRLWLQAKTSRKTSSGSTERERAALDVHEKLVPPRILITTAHIDEHVFFFLQCHHCCCSISMVWHGSVLHPAHCR